MFWLPWAVDAVIAAVAVFFFFVGLADGSVSSFNIVLWMVLLLAVAVVVGGSLSLGRSATHASRWASSGCRRSPDSSPSCSSWWC